MAKLGRKIQDDPKINISKSIKNSAKIAQALNAYNNKDRNTLEKFLCSEEHSQSSQFIYHKNVLSPEKYRAHAEGSDDEEITLKRDASTTSF